MSSAARLSSAAAILTSKTAIKPILLQPIRLSHGTEFRARPGLFSFQRAKDAMHFYIVGLIGLPFGAYMFYTKIKYGPCELVDYPEEGYAPRHWQYNREPFQQWCNKYFYHSEMSRYERAVGWRLWCQEKLYNNHVAKRVAHLMTERQDYKGYGYLPMKQRWIDNSRFVQEEEKMNQTWLKHDVAH